MLITRVSLYSGIERTKEIDVTLKQIWAWQHGELIQIAMPNLTLDDREFIKTGITPSEWEQLHGTE